MLSTRSRTQVQPIQQDNRFLRRNLAIIIPTRSRWNLESSIGTPKNELEWIS
ncbi:hypothetical protein K505DRAFT_324672 [Melanomma pulvis-pyrius CBS 109.77]|uniref:Uncharacterized protein n=1 Tax=Melanomma pulvis-pyrius CBS 109.77 TaxID=1314802 RepID=A0A6A6XDC1_9PLEO|nr:hypothetical protein K505DRAFT_324672 [Melanomma pulvis-pyrius CBS 109.77]